MDLSSLHSDQPLPDDDEYDGEYDGDRVCGECHGVLRDIVPAWRGWRWALPTGSFVGALPDVSFCTDDCLAHFLARNPNYEDEHEQ